MQSLIEAVERLNDARHADNARGDSFVPDKTDKAIDDVIALIEQHERPVDEDKVRNAFIDKGQHLEVEGDNPADEIYLTVDEAIEVVRPYLKQQQPVSVSVDWDALESEIVRAILLAQTAQKQGWVVLAAKEILYRLRNNLRPPNELSKAASECAHQLREAMMHLGKKWLENAPAIKRDMELAINDVRSITAAMQGETPIKATVDE